MEGSIKYFLNNTLCRIKNLQLGTNTYILALPGCTGKNRNCIIIDPGLDRISLDKALNETGWNPLSVFCTHGHFDHVGGTGWLQKEKNIPVYINNLDVKIANSSNFMLAAFKMNERIILPNFSTINYTYKSQVVIIKIDGREFSFYQMPGHTPGSIIICVDNLLFSGDSLYAKHIGLSKLPGENHNQLRESLHQLFNWVEKNIIVFPGHGEFSTIRKIQSENTELMNFMNKEIQK